MQESLDVQGIWWLPSSPDHKVHGWFSWDPEEGGTLRLAGTLRPQAWVENALSDGNIQRYLEPSSDQDKQYPRIHGQSGRQVFHLESSFQTRIITGLCREEDAAETVHVNWLIRGAWFDENGAPEVDGAVVDFQHLTQWINNDALQVQDADGKPGRFVTASSSWCAIDPMDIGDGMTLELTQQLGTDGDHHESLELQQRILLKLSSNKPRPVDDFTDRVSAFQDLLTIATGNVANIRKLHLTHRDVPQYSMAGTPFPDSREELALLTRWANRDADRERMSPYAMTFTYAHLGGAPGVRHWMLTAHKYSSELRRILAGKYNPSVFVEDRVGHCVAALESVDRVRRRDKDQGSFLIDRLRNCVHLAGEPFTDLLGGETSEAWVERAKNHRHALGHHLDRFRSNRNLVELELADQLEWLAKLCLLRESDAPDAVFEQIKRDSHFKWIAGRAAARVHASKTKA